ncbi:hypothetical protein B0A49_06317 [Cryomyces minteri]|uniref:Chromatin remodeling factor mit1 n=1 Tax=Cryomyces minteri TaxID=331657 RepID=A0A4U0X200_9PEZI|nr:hypothetical protein B0A49_06317 [Cryomyces minteri]
MAQISIDPIADPRGYISQNSRPDKDQHSPGLFVSEEEGSPSSALRQWTSMNGSSVRRKAVKDVVTDGVKVEIPRIMNLERHEYADFRPQAVKVKQILKELESKDGSEYVSYAVRFEDNHEIDNGPAALESFVSNPNTGDSAAEDNQLSETDRSDSVIMSLTSRNAKEGRKEGFIDFGDVSMSSDEDEIIGVPPTTRQMKPRTLLSNTKKRDVPDSPESVVSSASEKQPATRGSLRLTFKNVSRASRSSARRTQQPNYEDDLFEEGSGDEQQLSDDDELPYLQSDVASSRKRKRTTRQHLSRKSTTGSGLVLDKPRRSRPEAARRSNRATRHQGDMEEAGMDDIYRSDSDRAPAIPKAIGARETFKVLPRNIPSSDHSSTVRDVRSRITRHASVTGQVGNILSLSCSKKKDHTAPDQGKCQVCRETGASCAPFRARKSPLQEQKERDENGGEDLMEAVDLTRINNVDNVMFRCVSCWRAFHFQHLPSLAGGIELDEEDGVADERFREYCREWKCKDCADMPAKVSGLIAWKPIDEESYTTGFTSDMVEEDEKAYLVKWDRLSYFRASWMPGAWTWGVTASAMRKAFAKREDAQLPKMRTEDAISEEYLRIDIVLDVKFTSIVDIRTEEVDKARIREVDQALTKFKGLGYEDAVWEKPPSPEDDDRWMDYVTAYNDWVLGRYVHIPKTKPLAQRLDKTRLLDFATKLEKKKQPDNLVGGELMKYQLEGLNWLYYKWFSKQNAILADEMGLGKTIQIIGFVATLAQEHNCFPFLIVVPNSTCANWRREIKQWAPSLRVVAYFGSKEARDLSFRYELFPEGSKDLRCHIVVTSYDAAADDSCQRFFKSVPWQGLIVDEGQRLKNDKNLLYAALSALKIPFRVLLTGTPLQNNARELFNLLQFLDVNFDAAALELEYEVLTAQNVPKLHDLIRPFFLRRTKAQVLTFLPPMAQIILPVSMTVVQKKLYLSILAKNPDLLRAIFSVNRSLKQNERANLGNILMQLRKCLCHPFVFNREIEERNDAAAVSHRNLVEASAKLQLLEILLPKLKERGHRVLIFSQFLEMLSIMEDFLDGLEMRYQRLDGTMGSMQKQKRIDEFNAPDSPLFAFLLSTRAGGVGINLATADSVIILDPDFNPHQDIQALSRAHRIGQKNKVLCFQLMTRASAEEKIVQIGRKKMALDHVLIEQMDADDATDLDMESILRHGASELFDDNNEQDVRYDSISVDILLDRSQIENTRAGEDKSAESQFSFARIWANDQETLQDSLDVSEVEEHAPDPTVWDKILKERERAAAAEAAQRQQALGRGKRARTAVDYTTNERETAVDDGEGIDNTSPLKPVAGTKRNHDDDSDTDFQAEHTEGEESGPEGEGEAIDSMELNDDHQRKEVRGIAGSHARGIPEGEHKFLSASSPANSTTSVKTNTEIKSAIRKPVKAANKAAVTPVKARAKLSTKTTGKIAPQVVARPPPRVSRVVAAKALPKAATLAGVEFCNLCGIAHYGESRTCPHINSETQVRAMLEALKHSTEEGRLVKEAKRYLTGVKGSIVQRKKQLRERAMGGIVEGNVEGSRVDKEAGVPGFRLVQYAVPVAREP